MVRLLIVLLIILIGCVAEMEYFPVLEVKQTKSAKEPMVVINDVRNTLLRVDSCDAGWIEPVSVAYDDTVILCEMAEEMDTVFLYGSIEMNGVPLYEGVMKAPYGVVKAMELRDSAGHRIIYPIVFDVMVNEW